MTDDETPIACTLSPASYGERMKTIAALFARSLRMSRRDGRRLHLSFAPNDKVAVEDFVAKERECCAFLDFDLKATPEAVDVTITVPPRAAETVQAAETLLAPFLPGAKSCC